MFLGNVIVNGPLRGPGGGPGPVHSRRGPAWAVVMWHCQGRGGESAQPCSSQGRWPGLDPWLENPSGSDLPMTLGRSGLSSFVGNGQVGERAL